MQCLISVTHGLDALTAFHTVAARSVLFEVAGAYAIDRSHTMYKEHFVLAMDWHFML